MSDPIYSASLTANGSIVTIGHLAFDLIDGETPTHVAVSGSPVAQYNGTFEILSFSETVITFSAVGQAGGPVGVSVVLSVVASEPVPEPVIAAPSFLETLEGYQLAGIEALYAIIDDRLYPVEAPQNVAAPYGTFSQISASEDVHHGGKSGWGTMRVSYDFYGDRYHEVIDAARALRAEFEGKTVQVSATVQVVNASVESEFDGPRSEDRLWRRHLDLVFTYNHTA